MGNFDYSGKKSDGSKPFSSYACKDITVSGGESDYSLKENTDLFNAVTSPLQFLIRNGSEDISIRLNTIGSDSIPISGAAEFGLDSIIVTDMFVTVSGVSNATFNVITLGWQ
jgi:hypothetical protein